MRTLLNVRIKNILVTATVLISSATSCKKWIEADAPPTSISSGNIYANDATAASVLTGIYTQISSQDLGISDGAVTRVSLFTGLSADELTLYNSSNANYAAYYANDLSGILNYGTAFWKNIYPIIYDANAAIEGLNGSSGLTATIKQQLLGEAKFIRAFLYFYLVNLYGNLPLSTSTDYKINGALTRSDRSLVFRQIISDLLDAQNLLSPNYLDATILTETSQRLRPTKWAAAALLSKTYLYSGVNDSAEIEASIVINNNSQYSLDTLAGVFLMNSNEAIWQLQPVGAITQSNSGDGAIFNLPSSGPDGNLFPVYLSKYLLNSFELNDQRRTKWVDSVVVNGIIYYFPYKYRVGAVNEPTSEYIMMLRLGEQYLIRSEARARQNNISGSQSDLDIIRMRAGLDSTAAADQSALLTAIFHERQIELFTEWGSRWFDMQRFGIIDQLMDTITTQKDGGSWSSYKALFPIPASEIKLDQNLIQNQGYN